MLAPQAASPLEVAVIQFPGSNADWDALHAFGNVLGARAKYVFHKETSLGAAQALVIPGGFSHGDYLRPGSIACFSPIVESIRAFAERGGPILGICNGFQILTELGLLPGALTRNAHLRFECGDVFVRVSASGPLTDSIGKGHVLRLPVAHADGRYHCDSDTLRLLTEEDRIAFRYTNRDGEATAEANPNGSVDNIAGIYNGAKNVLGLMPHPERACESILGNEDGMTLLRAIEEHVLGSKEGGQPRVNA